MPKLSVIIITRNEERMIRDCLVSVQFADEIIVVDTGNTDETNSIAKEFKAKIVTSKGVGYDQFRNDGLKEATGDWILSVDADERVTPLLRAEITNIMQHPRKNVGAYDLPRTNIFLGKQMSHGGWSSDKVTRLFPAKSLKSWHNQLHEQPDFEGKLSELNNNLVHFSHRDLASMLEKTLQFTKFESENRIKANHPKMVVWRFLRVMGTEFWYRFIKLEAWRDGVEGVIDGMFQVFNTFIIYARLWELQNKGYEKSGDL